MTLPKGVIVRKQGVPPVHEKPVGFTRNDAAIKDVTCVDCGKITTDIVPETHRCRTCQRRVANQERERRRQLEYPYCNQVKEREPGPAPGTVAFIRNKEQEAAIARLARWRAEPWTFVREVFGVTPDDWQDEALHALTTDQMIAMKACKGPGKSAFLAWAGLWFLTCFADAKIICTSITADNLKDTLWSEFAKWINTSPMLKMLIVWQSERIYIRERPETWFISARTWPKDADQNKQAATLAGQHATNSMLIIDEGGGVPEAVVAAGLAHHSTQDDLVKETHLTLMAGNPDTLDSALGVACTRDRTKWKVIEITGDPDDPKRSKRIDIQWARDMISMWGAENPWVLVNVFGKFPPIQSNKLLGPDDVRAAQQLVIPTPLWANAARVMGVDVARSLGHDRSVVFRRQGGTAFPPNIFRIDDLMQLAGAVAQIANDFKPDAIFVDMIGLGSGVLDRLRELGYPAVGVNSALPSNDPRFENKRAEMWFRCAEEVKGNKHAPRLALPNEPTLVKELTDPTIKYSKRGKLQIESKDDMKKRGVGSPDVADGLVLTYAEPVVTARTSGAYSEGAIYDVVDTLKQAARSIDYDPYASTRDYNPLERN